MTEREVESVPGGSSALSRGTTAPPARHSVLLSPPPPGRLTSLRTRDLTLGAALKKPKKTFEPNVHAVRKSKDDCSKKERRQREGKRRECRGRRRERPQIIQSHSIFEQAPENTTWKTGWRGAADLQVTTASPACRPTKDERKDSKEDEEEILSKIQCDDFIDDLGLTNDAKLRPILLPLCQSTNVMKKESLINTLSTGHMSGFRTAPCGARGPTSKVQGPEQPSLVEVLRALRLSGQEDLFFMQLPDCMPGGAPGCPLKAGVSPTAGGATSKLDKRLKAAVNQQTPTGPGVKDTSMVLSDIPEGFLGKLQIRKSGKMQLKLGDIVMDVSEGAAFSFLQQLVSVRLSDARTGDMMVLGNVHRKLVLSPDFQVLLQEAVTEGAR
ncbi:DNA-directed RNA polymerase III subunit RPC4 [Thalassophryne amazonica]|uniref:DNA-directed RNA polymerase III subunit RPC4 n=1 Tax=Thalassophryne amazonica TaxID=390379 RepID=UPI0014712885|nr:DNA-directed RNA polymerase III subunit RPC4 [Thalassophryne amazonica]